MKFFLKKSGGNNKSRLRIYLKTVLFTDSCRLINTFVGKQLSDYLHHLLVELELTFIQLSQILVF